MFTLKRAFRSPNGAVQPEPRGNALGINSSLVKALKGRPNFGSPFQGSVDVPVDTQGVALG